MQDRQSQSEESQEWVADFLPLVKFVVSRMALPAGPLFDREDLVSYCVVGLIEARKRYSPDRGPFSTFAVSRIRGAILDAMRANDMLSRGRRHEVRIVEAAEERLTSLTGEATLHQLEALSGLSRKRIQEARAAGNLTLLSIERCHGTASEERNFAEELPDDEESTLERLVRQEQIAEVAREVALLPERERLVVALHFIEGLTMAEIARVLDISESRVSQLQARALERVRRSLALAA